MPLVILSPANHHRAIGRDTISRTAASTQRAKVCHASTRCPSKSAGMPLVILSPANHHRAIGRDAISRAAVPTQRAQPSERGLLRPADGRYQRQNARAQQRVKPNVLALLHDSTSLRVPASSWAGYLNYSTVFRETPRVVRTAFENGARFSHRFPERFMERYNSARGGNAWHRFGSCWSRAC